MGDANLLTVFTTGLLTGGLTCMAVQGGLLAATMAQRAQKNYELGIRNNGEVLPILSFLIAKLIAYTILGFFLGWFGSFFQLSITTQVVLQVIVAVFMIGTALNILDAHPIFRYFIIQPPKFIAKLIRNESKSSNAFAPILLGLLTVLIPCGTTQAMMALAIASGKPILGATIMFVFVLGTSPVFFLLGYFATRLTGTLHVTFMRVAAYAIILLAVFNINNSIALTGSSLTIDNLAKNVWCTVSFCTQSPILAAKIDAPVTEAIISIDERGYSPDTITVKRGSNITLRFNNSGGGGCAQAFAIPTLGIQKIIALGNTDSVTFTAPEKPGDIPFMCSMGMYRGTIRVI